MFSDIPLKMLWCPLSVTYFLIVSVKNRIQLSGVFSFILLAFAGSFIFETSYYLFSDLLEAIPTNVMFIDRLLQILVNFIFAYPFYFVLESIDRLTSAREDWRESAIKDQEHGSIT